MSIDAIVKDAVQFGVKLALSQEIQDIALSETRAVLREREAEFTALIRAAVRAALDEALK